LWISITFNFEFNFESLLIKSDNTNS